MVRLALGCRALPQDGGTAAKGVSRLPEWMARLGRSNAGDGPGTGLKMKNAVFGALIAVAGALTAIPGAQAQGYGYGYAPPPPPSWERERWHERMEWRERRHEYWRHRREMGERRAYEAGQRDGSHRQHSWGHR